MNYVWELMLQADNQKIDREKLRFVSSRNVSPYLEISQENLNAKEIIDLIVEINPLYRFSNEFSEITDINIVECEKSRNLFLDVVMHYLAQLDLRSGMDKQDFYIRCLENDLQKGVYGVKFQDSADCFSETEWDNYLICLMHIYRSGDCVGEFCKIVKEIYKQGLIYLSQDNANELFVYLGAKKTEMEERRINFLIQSFLPLSEIVHIFYENHFGIIGVDETMMFEEMEIF